MGKEIRIRDLCFSYRKNGNQLQSIDLDICAGEVVVLTGPSGSGKSSLTRVINGLIPYFYEGELEGTVHVDSVPLKSVPSWERGKMVGNVFQDPRSQFFANEVAGEIAFGCENYGFSHDEICARVHQAVRNMAIDHLLDNRLHTLSYGMRQKVAIASAQAIDPEIYVMDEPSANLDVESTHHFGELIRDLKRQGKTIVIAEHRLYYLMDIADRFVYIKHGKVRRIFSQEEMWRLSGEAVYDLGLRTPNLYHMRFGAKNVPQTDEKILEIKNLSKRFGDIVIAQNMNFQCKKGEIVAIIGPNGAGKSTLGRMLAGLQKEDAGAIYLLGKKSRRKERLGKVWYIPQDLDSQLFGENLLDELLTGAKESAERRNRAVALLKALELEHFVEQHPATLSGGQKQRLALGVALMYDAPIIILDEPTSGLDGANMRKVSHMIQKFAELGRTILVITHDAECALTCCHRAVRLQSGVITDDFSITNVKLLLDKIGYRGDVKKEVSV